MPNVSDLKQSKFLKKEDVMPEKLVTIAGWEKVDVSLESQPSDFKYVLNFKELPKPLVLNNTNGNRIAKITGSGEFDDWIGKQVVLFNDEMVEFAGKIVGGIRVKRRDGDQFSQDHNLPTAEQEATTEMTAEQEMADYEAAKDAHESKQNPY